MDTAVQVLNSDVYVILPSGSEQKSATEWKIPDATKTLCFKVEEQYTTLEEVEKSLRDYDSVTRRMINGIEIVQAIDTWKYVYYPEETRVYAYFESNGKIYCVYGLHMSEEDTVAIRSVINTMKRMDPTSPSMEPIVVHPGDKFTVKLWITKIEGTGYGGI